MTTHTIALLGAGSWGTAIAVHLAKCGNRVRLWARNAEHVREMQEAKVNKRYLPDSPFPEGLTATADLNECVQQADFCIIGVPSLAFSSLIQQITKPQQGLAWLTKGVDPDSHQLFSEVVAEHWGVDYPIAVISGPSFASEVAHNLPTALTLAGNNLTFQHKIQSLLHQNNVRVYLSNDVIGVQLCGAIKNVLAIACGISDGMGYGANAKAALITRGLAEMRRLGNALGARDESFMGLAGVGDLVLTCTDDQSRNRRFGLHLGRGENLATAEEKIGQVVEGRHNARQVCSLARQHGVEMPICMQIEALLTTSLTPQEAVTNLMNRSPRDE